MTPEDLAARFKPQLEAELAELRSASQDTAQTRKPVELDQQSVGRLSRMDALQNQAMANAVDSRRQHRITAIEAALQRIAEDEFGYCESCGEPIPEKRLELDPTFTQCVSCRGGG
ncbi:molecular chaperone DnaK [Thioclava sediminum]|uniref:Molecular chaperone DnaK n=1 Tax=Thioclava sediminum TaxID=1915319 RepID=A0ABX3MT95_9RHOB|nr:TraR/DksA family transcriptional regulator [Thioclava sediminum]OOY22920.1 molecular chaperone DnaK [Thioclava sediminum]